jgi:hypothetical protein
MNRRELLALAVTEEARGFSPSMLHTLICNAMDRIDKSAEPLLSQAAHDALCSYQLCVGETKSRGKIHEVTISGNWGNVEQAFSALPVSIQEAGYFSDSGVTGRREILWQVQTD